MHTVTEAEAQTHGIGLIVTRRRVEQGMYEQYDTDVQYKYLT